MTDKIEALKALAKLLRNSSHSICPIEQVGVAVIIDTLIQDLPAGEEFDKIINFAKKSSEIGGGAGQG